MKTSVRVPPAGGWIQLATALLVLFASVCIVRARVNVVSLPSRDSVQLTIYNSVDLTMVRESRVLVFRQGLNRLEFSWANTLIDPTSVEFRAVTHADRVEVMDARFPPRVPNTLEWHIQSEVAGEVMVEIRYFTSGINWSADYAAQAARNESAMDLAGHVRVNNRSGEDYENAEVRLVVGTIRLVEQIVQLARERSEEKLGRGLGLVTNALRFDADAAKQAYFAFADSLSEGTQAGFGGRGGGAPARQKAITKESVSEYFLYSVEGRDTIPNGWSKRLPSFKVGGVPITSYYKFERERWGEQVMRHYRFTNSEPSKLGKEPLPDGAVKAFRLATDDHLYDFVGRAQVKYIPIAEEVELELGADAEVRVKPVMMDWVKTDLRFDQEGNVKGWTIKETWDIEAQNSKPIDVMLDVRRNFGGDWSMMTQAKYEKVDANKIKFLVPLKPRERRVLTYELTTRQGINATR
jgi:hypothetical protein